MSRPRKCKKVCQLPFHTEFVPAANLTSEDWIIMTIEEYECIRLMDHEGFTQEQCAGYMQIARTTVQQIYNDARKKLASVLVDGKPLIIRGGSYKLCDGKETQCNCGGCGKHRYLQARQETVSE